MDVRPVGPLLGLWGVDRLSAEGRGPVQSIGAKAQGHGQTTIPLEVNTRWKSQGRGPK
jgi:hypothetical protein